jgi:4-hydroxybenzoate polyprenyltransferase
VIEAAGPVRLFASVSRLHIVAIASLGTFTFGWLFTGRYLWLLAAISALDWFVVNLVNRVVDLPEDRLNAVIGTDFVARHHRGLLAVGLILLLGSLAALHPLAPAILPLRVCFHALGLAYNWPLLPGRRRIKELYFWKNTASAMGFMLTVFGFPLATAGWGMDPSALAPGIDLWAILATAAFFLPFELSYEVIYDLRDATGDRAAGVRSYPVAHGEAGAVRIIDALMGASALVLALSFSMGVIPWRIFVLIAAPALQFVLYKRLHRRGLTSADCTGMTWLGAGLLLTYHLWVVAGLPGIGG